MSLLYFWSTEGEGRKMTEIFQGEKNEWVERKKARKLCVCGVKPQILSEKDLLNFKAKKFSFVEKKNFCF